MEPVIHPPRKVPVALRKSLREELQRMEALDVITKTTEPTEWVNSLVIARKKNGKIRVCMDPGSLNKAIRREHYPVRTIEEVISRMPNVFSMQTMGFGRSSSFQKAPNYAHSTHHLADTHSRDYHLE